VEKNRFCRVRTGENLPIRMKNPSGAESAKFLDIWLELDESPAFDIHSGDCRFPSGAYRFLTIASGQGHEEAVPLVQDTAVHYFHLQQNESFIFETLPYRSTYLWIWKGALSVDNYRILNQDGVIISGEPVVAFTAQQHTTALLIDLPGEPPEEEEDPKFQEPNPKAAKPQPKS